LDAASFGASASWPSWPGRVSATRLTLYHGARALHARQAGSRLPLTAGDGRPQISGDVPGAATGPGDVRRRLRARCSRTYWRTIAVTICPGKTGHK
jgi:hypothetical protein